MTKRRAVFLILACLFLAAPVLAFPRLKQFTRRNFKPLPGVAEGQTVRLTVEGVERTALIVPNSAAAPSAGAPVVFVFHGHGGNIRNAARKMPFHTLMPEAVTAYLQGLPGVEGINDEGGEKPGWQKSPGELGDRDVKFFDALLNHLQQEFKTDPNRVYLVGHSNGARFAHVLWNMRGDKIAALCSASAQGGALMIDAVPRSVFMIAGEKDPLVPFEAQMKSVELARKLLETDPSKALTQGYAVLEPGKDGLELGTYLHPGGHEFPAASQPLVAAFFRRHPRQ